MPSFRRAADHRRFNGSSTLLGALAVVTLRSDLAFDRCAGRTILCIGQMLDANELVPDVVEGAQHFIQLGLDDVLQYGLLLQCSNSFDPRAL